jgi:hypothetical protein
MSRRTIDQSCSDQGQQSKDNKKEKGTMSEVRLVIREAVYDWSGTVPASSADRMIAALSADPITLKELEAACARFGNPTANQRLIANLLPGLCDEPYDAGIVVIDLVARLVVVESTYSSPRATGEVSYHDGQCATDICLRYHLAEDWLLISDRNQWSAIAENRRQERVIRPLLDTREVFYGRSLVEFVARETFAAFSRRKTIDAPRTDDNSDGSRPRTDKEITHDTLKQIHATWLLTPREDLGGICPRDVALERRNHLTWDLQDQCGRWSLLGKCPPGLDKSSFAFRYGGFGIHELVQYYDLVRELLYSCWERLVELEIPSTAHGQETLTVEDFLTNEVSRLESVRDHWLEMPNPEYHGRTPRSIIDRERVRLPETMSRHDAIIDADCPCCQMLADMPGPMFWHLDGSSMDNDFAFDISHRTREEWEAEQRQWEEYNRRFEAEWAERQRQSGTPSGSNELVKEPVWSSSFSAEDADEPLVVHLFGIGCHLAELIDDIRGPAKSSVEPQVQRFIDHLNRDFGNLRELLQTSELSVAEALLHPVIDRFIDTLAAVAVASPDLSGKCESLTSSLTKFLNPHSLGSSWGSDHSDDPF